MSYTIDRTEYEILICLPIDSTPKIVQNALNFLKYLEIGKNSQITPEDVEELVKETKDR